MTSGRGKPGRGVESSSRLLLPYAEQQHNLLPATCTAVAVAVAVACLPRRPFAFGPSFFKFNFAFGICLICILLSN